MEEEYISDEDVAGAIVAQVVALTLAELGPAKGAVVMRKVIEIMRRFESVEDGPVGAAN